MTVREYRQEDIGRMVGIWNEVIEEGQAFPQLELLDEESGRTFFAAQDRSAVVEHNGEVIGLYILHPNNVGRCAGIANASYAVLSHFRGMHAGEALVKDSLEWAKMLDFKVMQFNAVVESNIHARHLYERLGFVPLGIVPQGFRMKDGHYENICLYYHTL